MRKVSEILQLMIDTGHYGKYRCRYMCKALESALQEQVITVDEYVAAKNWIDDIIEEHCTLYSYLLRVHDYAADFSGMMRWYNKRIAGLQAEGK